MLIFQSWPKYIESSGALLITLMINHMMTSMSSARVWSFNTWWRWSLCFRNRTEYFPQVWVEGSNHTPSFESTSHFLLCGNQTHVALPAWWWGRCGIFRLIPDAVTRKPLPSSTVIPNLCSFVYKLQWPWTKKNWDFGYGLFGPLSTQDPIIDWGFMPLLELSSLGME